MIFGLIVIFCFFSGNLAQNLTIRIDNGWILGSSMISYSGKEFYAFRSIPYGEAPIGRLRFQASTLRRPWSGVLDATEDNIICPQINEGLDNPQSEDCLLLNVYTNKVPEPQSLRTRPVIMYLHGGAARGSKNSVPSLGPEYLMDRDFILVTINYRMGKLGLLSTGTKDAPGNAGFKDQVLALQWIQRNIRYFNGDPTSVTLVGHSAGAGFGLLHLASPMSSRLFHQAILLSGPIPMNVNLPTNTLDVAKAEAKDFECPTDNITAMVQCLQEVPIDDFINNQPASQNAVLMATPVIEEDFGQQRFLTEEPLESFRTGSFNKVPVMIGIVSGENANMAPLMLFNASLGDLMLKSLMGLGDSEIQKLYAHYMHFDRIDIRSFQRISDLFGDALFGYPTHQIVHMIANYTNVFYYEFSQVFRYSNFYFPGNLPFDVVHADELHYMYYRSRVTPLFTPSDPESVAIERWTRIWENFALKSDPNNANDHYLKDMKWTPFTWTRENYLGFGTHLIERNGLNLDRYKIWDEIAPFYTSTSAQEFSFLLNIL